MGIRDINNSLKGGGMSKRGKFTNGESWKMLEVQKIALPKQK